MDPASNAHGTHKEGPPAGVIKAAGPTTDRSQEKPSDLPVNPSPRPARLASPASSCRGGAAATPPRQALPAGVAGRSVKSIVEWLEGPKQPDSPPTTSVASGPGRKATSAASVASAPLDQPLDQPLDHHRPADQSIARAEDVEDYSLTYLNYRGFYLEAPLARCLDGVDKDLSKKPLEDVFKDAEKRTASGRTVVNVTSPTPSSSAAAKEKTSTSIGEDADASKQAAVPDKESANVGHAKVPQVTAAGSAGAAAGPAEPGGSDIADAKKATDGPTGRIAAAGNQVSAAAPAAGGEVQEFIQRDPQEVEAF
ncbi:hypothetical protein HRG_006987 [Hirsutella rhossiliensis]|uniref:Uncharacterized protein n=1 Tax=Hirsutella rhossiliensis TaxID=111463 RepID=A0A9P8MV03_9HYPO|nr:uncharacterized protein HRG_06987 [Hirsutella rhossiliensis]KAH0961907.1 hypothetical protein HRG_06987 [Hirsutella rhossiliensis]